MYMHQVELTEHFDSVMSSGVPQFFLLHTELQKRVALFSVHAPIITSIPPHHQNLVRLSLRTLWHHEGWLWMPDINVL